MGYCISESRPTGIWRFSRRDGILVLLAGLHGLVLAARPAGPLIAIGIWWNANTVAHNFIHRPFFRSSVLNSMFSGVLSVLLGVPQTLWRDRHLAHHAGVVWRWRVSRQLTFETALVVVLWAVLARWYPRFFLASYVPGFLAGMGLCALQGYWEHAAGSPTSYYGYLYNLFCFNDGFHAEHHADSSIHWTALPDHTEVGAAISGRPPLLRWLDVRPLELLERLVLASPSLQRFVLRSHRRAFQRLLPLLKSVGCATIVGGGLFPRTALILRELLPAAQLTIMDSSARNLQIARKFLGETVHYRHERYAHGGSLECDLTVIPLSLDGDRAEIYRSKPSTTVLVHDWIWHARGEGTIVSLVLLKRLNLVQR